MIRRVLTAEQRRWLRTLVDETARLRLAEAQPGAHRCAGCDCRLSERTTGCASCENRHKARRRRLRARWVELASPHPTRAGGYRRWSSG
jgi:hypothetical protein